MPSKTIYRRMKNLNARMMANYKRGFGPTRVVMLLTTIGRKSGLPRQTPLQYEEIEGVYYVGSARGVQADACCHAGFDFIIQAGAVGIQVKMIGSGCAARKRQLRQSGVGRDAHVIGRQPRPDRVERDQPVEQDAVLRDAAGEGLVKMVVRVDQPWQDDHAPGVDHRVGGLGQLGGRTGLDASSYTVL